MIITTPISSRTPPKDFTSSTIDDWLGDQEKEKVAEAEAAQGGMFGGPITGQEILVPTFEIALNPTIRISDVKARRFYITDRAQIKAKENLQAAEDAAIFDAISGMGNDDDIFTPISEWGEKGD